MITTTTRVTTAPDVYAREFDGELVIVDLNGGEYFGLDQVGARIWDLLVAGASVEEAVTRIAATHDAPVERIRGDVVEITEKLVTHGLLRVVEGPVTL